MLKTIIVDDEKMAIQSLNLIIRDYCPDLEIIKTANNPLEAIKQISHTKPLTSS